MKLTLRALACALILASCSNDSPDDVSEYVAVPNVTYTGQVKSIIDSNCLFCHSDPPQNGAPIKLTTYEDVKAAVLSRGLVDRISLPQGNEAMMPKGGQRLPQNVIDIVKQWRDEGAPQ